MSSYRRKISDSVRKASSLLDENNAIVSLGLTGQQSLRSMTSWLRSRTSNIIESLVGVRKGDISIGHARTSARWYLDDQTDWAEQEVVLTMFFPCTVDRMDRQLLEMESEVRCCRDELNIVYLAVMKLNTRVYEDVFDGPDLARKDFKHEEEAEVDPIVKLAVAASEQEIEHYETDKIGQIYSVSRRHFGTPSECLQVGDGLELSCDDNIFMKVDFCFDLELDVTIAGEDLLNQIQLVKDDLTPSKDILKVTDGDNCEILGERLVTLKKHQKRIRSRVMIMKGVVGIHMAWFTALELGCFDI